MCVFQALNVAILVVCLLEFSIVMLGYEDPENEDKKVPLVYIITPLVKSTAVVRT